MNRPWAAAAALAILLPTPSFAAVHPSMTTGCPETALAVGKRQPGFLGLPARSCALALGHCAPAPRVKLATQSIGRVDLPPSAKSQ